MTLQQPFSRTWKLKEFIQIGSDPCDENAPVPLQLLFFQGARAESSSAPLWFLSGFQGPARNDAHVSSLLQKALHKFAFDPAADIYMTPVSNPEGFPLSKNNRGGKSKGLSLDFAHPAIALGKDQQGTKSVEASSLMRWTQTIRPKAIVTLSVGAPYIRHLNAPHDVVQKLSELSERPAYLYGTEPAEKDQDGNEVVRENLEAHFASWCAELGITWLDFSIDTNRKNFEEIRDADWRPCIGPAMKWLVEGFRFNPPKEEAPFPLPKVIPAIELPPEFANL